MDNETELKTGLITDIEASIYETGGTGATDPWSVGWDKAVDQFEAILNQAKKRNESIETLVAQLYASLSELYDENVHSPEQHGFNQALDQLADELSGILINGIPAPQYNSDPAIASPAKMSL